MIHLFTLIITIRILAKIGIVRIQNGSIRWPIHVGSPHYWVVLSRWPGQRVGVFRNLPGVIKWERGRLLPRRWGFYVLGLEIGDRG